MDMREFAAKIQDEIIHYLPDEYEGATVDIVSVPKNGETLTGLSIRKEYNVISPNIYLDDYLEDFEEGRSLNDILESIAQVRVEYDVPDMHKNLGFDIFNMTLDTVGDRIEAILLPREGNEALLESRPHTDKLDMAIFYRIVIDNEKSIPITNQIAEKLGVESVESLNELALNNTFEHHTFAAKSMYETIIEMMGEEMFELQLGEKVPPEMDQIVVTNENKVNGSIAMLNDEVMKDIVDKRGDVFIIPSSVHEIIVLSPESMGYDYHKAEEMLREVNRTQVAPQDFLSDTLYGYTAAEGLVYARDMVFNRDKELLRTQDLKISLSEDGLMITFKNDNLDESRVYSDSIGNTLVIGAGEEISFTDPTIVANIQNEIDNGTAIIEGATQDNNERQLDKPEISLSDDE